MSDSRKNFIFRALSNMIIQGMSLPGICLQFKPWITRNFRFSRWIQSGLNVITGRQIWLQLFNYFFWWTFLKGIVGNYWSWVRKFPMVLLTMIMLIVLLGVSTLTKLVISFKIERNTLTEPVFSLNFEKN